MNHHSALPVYVLSAAVLLSGCIAPSGNRRVDEGETKTAEGTASRDLNIGYSLLYETLGKQQQMEKVLWVKLESDSVEQMVKSITAAAGDAQKQLTTLSTRWPEIDLKTRIPLSTVEAEARKSGQQERTKNLLREKGKSFERLLLFSQSGVLNQERHMVRALLKLDRHKERQAILEGINDKLDRTYETLQKFMEAHYFSR